MIDHEYSGAFGFGLDGVAVAYAERYAVEDLTLYVEPGERLAVIGASGAGKSTLFRLLTRSVGVSSGKVSLGGRNLFGLSWRELKDVRRRVGVVRQAYNLVPQLPVGVNAALGEVGSFSGWQSLRTLVAGPDAALSRRVRDALEQLELSDMASLRTSDISGGQQQRVAVARLLVQRPGLVLADEPFAAVDPRTTERVLESLVELNEQSSTLVVNLHDVEIARRFPRVVALREGRLFYDGSPDGLTDEKLADLYSGDPFSPSKRPQDPPAGRPSVELDPERMTGGKDGLV